MARSPKCGYGLMVPQNFTCPKVLVEMIPQMMVDLKLQKNELISQALAKFLGKDWEKVKTENEEKYPDPFSKK